MRGKTNLIFSIQVRILNQTFMFYLSSPSVPLSRLYRIIDIITLQVEIHESDFKEGNYSKAEKKIKQAMFKRPHSPEAHNLYGILEELQSNGNLVRKHYRAAYALDPTYKAATRNLERIINFEYYLYNKKTVMVINLR